MLAASSKEKTMVTKQQAKAKLKPAEDKTDSLLERWKKSEWSVVIAAGQAIAFAALGAWIASKSC